MAVKDCDDLSNIIAIGIISGDDELAKEIANLSSKKKDALVRAGKLKSEDSVEELTGWSAHELELKANSADIELRAIVQTKILTGEIGTAEARLALAEQIAKSGGSMAEGIKLLDKVRSAKVTDFQDIAKLWGGAYKNYPAKAKKEMEEAIATNISANYSIRKYSDFMSGEVSDLKTQFKEGKITQEEYNKQMEGLHKKVMDKINAGENPKDFVPIDREWDAIKKAYTPNEKATAKKKKELLEAREKAWNQYVMARELLADGKVDDKLLSAFSKLGARNLTGKIDMDTIARFGKGDLDKMLALAFTNTEQFYSDGALREAFRQKLVQVTSGMRVTKENLDKATTIMNTIAFMEQGATFADIATADAAGRAARKRGFKVNDGKKFLNSLKAFLKKEEDKMFDGPIVIDGIEMTAKDVIQIVYDLTGDENILKLLRIGFYSDNIVLSIATSKLFGNNEEAAAKILKLFSKAKEGNKITNVRNLSLKAITGEEVKEGAKVGFFDFRKHLYSKDELNRTKADFYDKLAEKNKMKVASDGIEDITLDTEDADEIAKKLRGFKGGYIIVNDARYKTNKAFNDALNKVNSEFKNEDDKIRCIFPRGGMSSSFAMEGGQLYFKTMDDKAFDSIAGTISIQTLGKSRPTREILAKAFEAKTGKNGDRIRYQASYSRGAVDSQGRKISDQQHSYFSNSEVKDENGNLIPCYHGTRSRFDTPKMEKGKVQAYGPGMYFTTKKSTADYYSETAGGLLGFLKPKRVIEVYLDIRKPLSDAATDWDDAWIDQLKAMGYHIDRYDYKYLMDKKYSPYSKYKYLYLSQESDVRPRLVEDFKRISGYDGVKAEQGGGETYWIPFTSNQIKYVDNRVPTESPNMKFQEREEITEFESRRGSKRWRLIEKEFSGEGLDKEAFEAFTRAEMDAAAIWDKIEIGADGSIKDFTTEQRWKESMPEQKMAIYSRLTTFNDLLISLVNSKRSAEEMLDVIKNFRGFPNSLGLNDLLKFTQDFDDLKVRLRAEVVGLDYNTKFPAVTKYKGRDYKDVVKELYNNGFFPYEFRIETTKNGKVDTVYFGNGYSVAGSRRKGPGKGFHNHPSGLPFSLDDYDAFITQGKAHEGLILPGGVVFDFENTPYFRKEVKRINAEYKNDDYWGAPLDGTMRYLIDLSADLGTINNQERGVFQDFIEKYKDNLSKRVNRRSTEMISEIEEIADRENEKMIESMIDYLTPAGEKQPSFMRRLDDYASQADETATDAIKAAMFTKDRTVEQIAEAYGISVEFVKGTNMIEGVEAYGAYGNGVIYFTDMVKESTAPHELFHAIFDMHVGKEQHDKILKEGAKLFNTTEDKLEEILADSFAHWFNTGEFVYGDELKKLVGKQKFNKQEKSFVDKILQTFKDLAEWLGLMDSHREEVEQMFKDMVNMEYLPEIGKNVEATKAMIQYNDELEKSAIKYYGQLLGDYQEELSPEYIERIRTKLSEKTGIDFKAFDQFEDKSALWKKVDEAMTVDKMTSGRYDKEIANINDIKNGIEKLTDKELEAKIFEDLGVLGKGGAVVGRDNIDHIREAYLDYKTAGSAIDSLAAKGKLVSLIHGGEAKTMSMDEVRQMFQNGTFAQKYKEMFFPNQKLTEEEEKQFISAINDNIFDILSVQFAENLVRAGYDLPLVNVKTFIYDYLNGKLDLNNKFVEAFLYKNNIPFTSDGLKGIVDTLMPSELKFNYEDSLFKNRFGQVENLGDRAVFTEIDNRFVMDSYSALAGIELARRGGLPANEERKILEDILTRYVDAVKKGVREGTLDFKGAQELKQEASYALDMFEQDILLPKYGIFLTPQEKQGLMGMKFDLPIGVKGQNISKLEKELEGIKTKLLEKYDNTLGSVAENNDINAAILKGIKGEDEKMQKKIDARKELLAERGGVIKEVNGQYLVYNSRQALENALEDLPASIGGLEGLRALGKEGIESLSNRQAYALLRYVEAAKSLDATAGYAMELMYKQNPMLLKYNFFEAYRVGDQGIPKALEGNSLNFDPLLSKLENTAKLDETSKKNIFEGVIAKFRSQGYVTTDDLDAIIDKGIKEAYSVYKQSKLPARKITKATNKMKNIYKKAFAPYTYLRDIPSGGTVDGVTFRDIKSKVRSAMKQQYNQAMEDLKSLGMADMEGIQDSLYLTLPNGQKMSLRDASGLDVDSWKKGIFNDESVYVAGADELGAVGKKTVEEQKEFRKAMVNEYDSTLQTILNQSQFISESERALQGSIMSDVRAMLRRGNLTNIIVDALDAVSGLNEEAARGIKDYLIGWKGNISFGKWKSSQIIERNDLVKKAYAQYYAMDLAKLNKITPSTKAEDLALRLAKYFKNLERLLGSADGITGCTTSNQLNRAFFHIGEVVMSVDSVKGIFGLLSAVEQNQILKFFKFAKGDLRQQADVFIRKGKGNFSESLGGYRDYAEDISGITRDEFNEIFGSNLTEDEFKKALQGLTGFSLVGGVTKPIMKALNFLSGTNFIFRAAMSYPGQLLTIPLQSAAYFLKQIGFERALDIDSMSEIDAVRTHYGILDGAYNEINWFKSKSKVSPDDIRIESYYNRYGIPDVEGIYKATAIETSDDYISMYAKINNDAASSISSTNKWLRQLDPYKDNANNIIDGLFARNFKNIAFQKAIRQNDFMQFSSAREFMAFMDDPTVSGAIKTKLMDRVAAYSGRNFRNILGLGFGGIDRAVGGSGFGNIMYGLMQMFNFRGSWGQNIFKQAGAAIKTGLKIAKSTPWLSAEGREALSRFIATQPEFMNFVGALFNDMKWAWRLQRFQDNGRWPDNEDMYITTEFGDVFDTYSALDFIDYLTESMNLTSQIFQGIQSFGPARPVLEGIESAYNSYMDPTIYKDIFGIGAFFNALGKNFGRQWKPHNWIAKALGALTTDGPEAFWTYVQNEFYKLSFGSVRYMVNEDSNSYGYTFEMTGQQGGIPSILMGEGQQGSDKEFSYEIDNTETWETIKQIFNGGNSRSDRLTYAGNLGKAFVNGSQFFSLWKNAGRAWNKNAPSYYTAHDLADVLQNTEAGLEFYQKGIVTPKTKEEAEIFFDTILENSKYRPGSSNFTKSLIQYEDYGHMNGKETGNEADAEMELWLDHMKHLTNEHGVIRKNGDEKIVDPSWEKLVSAVRSGAYNDTYTTSLIYNYAKTWLDNHSSDPNYQLYMKLLGQGQAHNLIENTQDDIIKARNAGKKGTDNKWTETEFKNVGLRRDMLLAMGNTPLPGDTEIFFDKLQVLDQDSATVAALQIIQNQAKEGDRKIIDRFFNVKENDDGTKSVTLRKQYESTLTQIGAVAKAIDDGNLERAISEASTLTNMYKNADPTGAVTATLIDSVYNRIYDTDSFSPEQKQEAMIALFHHNKEFIQKNPEKMRELLGDEYDTYANYMNQMLYQWDGALLSTLESMQSSGKGSSGTAKKSKAMSNELKKLANSIGNNEGGARGTGSIGSTKQWVPVVIKGANLVKELGLKGYTPNKVSVKFSSYKPHVDLSIGKDINRKVKGPKTQQISNKKQLSKIEDKVEKAIEAES